MRVASVCSSVGGLDLGLHRAGHETVFFCEFDAWRRKVLARHWPGVPIHHDLEGLRALDVPACDLFVGGTPCQDLSQSGRRAGLDGERSGLFHAFAQLRLDLFDLHGTEWSLWENVAGALSSNDGADFATVLASHVGADVPVPAAGWGGSGLVAGPWGTAEWRLLDAQFFGVPQRRRRVFVVGHLGAVDPVEVLSDTPRSQGNSQARRVPGKGTPDGSGGSPRVAGSLTASHGGGLRIGAEEAAGNHIVAGALLSAHRGVPNAEQVAGRHVVAFHATQDPISGSVSPALGTSMHVGVSFAENQQGEVVEASVFPALSTGGGKPGQGYPAARTEQGVRRLTPTERERLMGWPDGWTYDHGPSLVDAPQGWPSGAHAPLDLRPDGRRDSGTGDGVVAHVAEWIGHGLEAVSA